MEGKRKSVYEPHTLHKRVKFDATAPDPSTLHPEHRRKRQYDELSAADDVAAGPSDYSSRAVRPKLVDVERDRYMSRRDMLRLPPQDSGFRIRDPILQDADRRRKERADAAEARIQGRRRHLADSSGDGSGDDFVDGFANLTLGGGARIARRSARRTRHAAHRAARRVRRVVRRVVRRAKRSEHS